MSQATFKGRHTTVYSELLPLEGGGYVADTPGIRSLGLWDVEPEELDAYFVDIEPYVAQCEFNDCTHVHEPGCAVLAAVKRADCGFALRELPPAAVRGRVEASKNRAKLAFLPKLPLAYGLYVLYNLHC